MNLPTRTQNGVKRSNRRPRVTTRAALCAGSGTREAIKDAKWSWHYRVLRELRERLVGEAVELMEKVSQPCEPPGMDIADWATEEFDRDFSVSRLSILQHALIEVDDAIERMGNGTYGVCQETGKPIAETRLKAVPWTRFAGDVEERLEDKGAVGGSQLEHVGLVRDSFADGREVFECAGEEGTGESVANDEALWCVNS